MNKFTIILSLISVFIHAQVPQIDSFSPAVAEVGEQINIYGSGFDTTPSNNIVYFGGVKALVNTASQTQLTVTIPVGVYASRIQLTNIVTNLVVMSGSRFIPKYDLSSALVAGSYSDNSFTVGSLERDHGETFAISDINGDGNPDILFQDLVGSTRKLNYLLNNTSQNQQPSSTQINSVVEMSSWAGSAYGGGPIAVSDFNADGELDILCGSVGYNGTKMLLNLTGGGSPEQQTYAPSSYQAGVRAIDFENDGDIDLISTYFHPSINFYEQVNNTVGGSNTVSFTATVTNFTSGSTGTAIADLDGNGYSDILISTGSSLFIRPLSDTGYLTEVVLSSVNGNDIALADFDGNGLEDIVVDYSSGIYVYKNTSTPGAVSFTGPIDISSGLSGVSALDIVDINNDNLPDIIASTSSRIYIYENTSTTGLHSFNAGVQVSTNSQSAYDLKVVDINNDGVPEIITGGSSIRIQNFTAQPEVTVVQNISAFETCQSLSSTSQNFTVSGENLTAEISINAPSGYEVSTDNSTFSSSLTLSQASGTVAEATIYVRLTGASSGDFSSNISITSQNATSVDIALTGTVYESPVISGNSSIEYNTTATFTATTTPSAPAPWSSSNTSVGTITDSGEFSALALGTTTISFENSNGCIDTLEINVVDTTAPVITLAGDATVTLEVGATYNEQGATATDNYDTSVTVTIGGDIVDTNTVGTYTVTYDATDANSNAATQVTRTVNVVDTTAPVITLAGDATVTLEVGATYNEQGATATDNYDTSVTVTIGGDIVDTNTVGTYTVTYNASDAAGNNATEVTRTVNVVDSTAPVITLTGDATVTLEVGATYTDLGATATDNYDTSVTVTVGGDTVDTTTVGTYTVTYNASDAAGNNATEVTRTVNVVDSTAPVITLTGDATVTLEVGATYTDLGATATDNYDTSVTVTVGGDTVDTTTVGTYTVTYNASDAAGNNATEVTRTVNVVESLSVNEINEVKLSIFPNPASTHWNIKAKNEIKSISLYDISGRKILHEKPYNKNVEINAQSLPSGVYLLSVNKTNTFRLIKL
jgi:hypothetical protein